MTCPHNVNLSIAATAITTCLFLSLHLRKRRVLETNGSKPVCCLERAIARKAIGVSQFYWFGSNWGRRLTLGALIEKLSWPEFRKVSQFHQSWTNSPPSSVLKQRWWFKKGKYAKRNLRISTCTETQTLRFYSCSLLRHLSKHLTEWDTKPWKSLNIKLSHA